MPRKRNHPADSLFDPADPTVLLFQSIVTALQEVLEQNSYIIELLTGEGEELEEPSSARIFEFPGQIKLPL